MWYKLNTDKTFIKVDKVEDATMTELERRVRYNKLSRTTEISTVFLGLNHGTEEEPILFETLIITRSKKIKKLDQYIKRYKTWEGAEKAHNMLVDFINKKLKEKIED